ncbi:hypothetical protein PMAYCL1PPCAC_25210 [Pristionchus mayeri]|uniref:BTB domain-containing protein n=1 Tax=Pristionchus mayeri TaxID=1317129 RepID=A0AAN5D3D5_9BILA|nr:hypothetical protein PMAYCL1PPCAC_25210 [Pristionchus mayeri]
MKNTPPDGIIRFEIDKVSTLGSNGRRHQYSPEVEIGGIPWKTFAWLIDGSDLGVTIECKNTQSTLWRIDAYAELSLVHPDGGNNINVEGTYKFERGNCMDYEHLMKNQEFFKNDKGFIKDNKIVIEIRLWLSSTKGIRIARRVDFTNPNTTYHDVTLIIQGQKIYASKQILAAASPVFESMFFSDFAEKNKNEIELNDVDREGFVELLYVIYPTNKKITEESVEVLLHLSDQFQITSIIERAEEFLIDNEYILNSDKLRLADRYRLFGLQEHCFSECKTKEDFKDIKESPLYNGLSDATKIAFLEHHFENSM